MKSILILLGLTLFVQAPAQEVIYVEETIGFTDLMLGPDGRPRLNEKSGVEGALAVSFDKDKPKTWHTFKAKSVKQTGDAIAITMEGGHVFYMIWVRADKTWYFPEVTDLSKVPSEDEVIDVSTLDGVYLALQRQDTRQMAHRIKMAEAGDVDQKRTVDFIAKRYPHPLLKRFLTPAENKASPVSTTTPVPAPPPGMQSPRRP